MYHVWKVKYQKECISIDKLIKIYEIYESSQSRLPWLAVAIGNTVLKESWQQEVLVYNICAHAFWAHTEYG